MLNLEDVRAKSYVYSTFTPKREGLINVRKIHCQEHARPRFDPAQHQHGIGQIVNSKLAPPAPPPVIVNLLAVSPRLRAE